jgi:two-component system response regulator NreC
MAAESETDAPATPARDVLVDDHGVVRAGLRRLLESTDEFEVAGEAGTLRDALETIEVKRPDLVVLDITLGDEDALEAMPEIIHKGRGAKVLILSMHDDTEHVQHAFAAGADGYLLKESAESDLIDALEALRRGERYVHPTLGARLARAALEGPEDPLTDRERDIARLLALGHTNQDIAGQLYLSVRTVETHRAHVMAKLQLGSRADLVRWALDRGLIGKS